MSKTSAAKQTAMLQFSMTGFAQAVRDDDGWTMTVSLRSVNHRFLDLRLHLPELFYPLENKIRKEMQASNPRGHVDLRVSLDSKAGSSVVVDEQLVEKYLHQFRALGEKHNLPFQTDVPALFRLPGVVSLSGNLQSREIPPLLEALFWDACREALASWDAMRAGEANFLVDDMNNRLAAMLLEVRRIAQSQESMVASASRKLQERLQALAEQTPLDPARLAQEAAMLADRADTCEEVVRLESHIQQFQTLLATEASCGRKLDFLLQEMHRELNTLLSKTASLGEVSLPLTRAGIDIKANVEKLREQVQNLQ